MGRYSHKQKEALRFGRWVYPPYDADGVPSLVQWARVDAGRLTLTVGFFDGQRSVVAIECAVVLYNLFTSALTREEWMDAEGRLRKLWTPLNPARVPLPLTRPPDASTGRISLPAVTRRLRLVRKD